MRRLAGLSEVIPNYHKERWDSLATRMCYIINNNIHSVKLNLMGVI